MPMRFTPDRCPACGEPPRGSVESLSGVAQFQPPDEKGEFEYDGYTDVWWDDQKTVRNKEGKVQLVCDSGHDWFADMTESD